MPMISWWRARTVSDHLGPGPENLFPRIRGTLLSEIMDFHDVQVVKQWF